LLGKCIFCQLNEQRCRNNVCMDGYSNKCKRCFGRIGLFDHANAYCYYFFGGNSCLYNHANS
jgi:hypothetical protein